jgi:acyl-CoA thioesterase FadM
MNQNYCFETSYQIQEKEIDNVYKHAHHVFIVELLERCRLDFLRAIELPSEMLIAQDYYLVLTRIEISFLRELRAGMVLITCHNPRIKDKQIILEQKISNLRRKSAVEAKVELVFIRGSTRRATHPPKDFVKGFCSAIIKA